MAPSPLERLGIRRHGDEGPAVVASPPRQGPVGAVLAGIRLPADLLVAVGATVRAVPYVVQDARSIVNDTARIMRHNDPELLGEILDGLARVAAPDGALTNLLAAAAELAEARTERERAETPGTRRTRSG